MNIGPGPRQRPTAFQQYRRLQQHIYIGYGALILVTLFILQVMRIYSPVLGASLFVLIAICGIAIVRPDIGLGVAIVAAIVGDGRSMPWWPAVKNLSSRESALYVADGVSISPLELMLGVVVVSWWLGRSLRSDRRPIELGPFWIPLAIFAVSLGTGLAWGVGRSGDFRVALFEMRPLLLIPIVYVAAINLFTTMRHYRILLWGILAALTVEAVHALFRLPTMRAVLPEGQSPVDHTAALHMNLMILLFIAGLWFGTNKLGKRPLLLLALIPVVWLYLAAERRAGVVGLAIGGGYLAFVLFSKNRAKFKRIIPVMAIISVAYVGAFWGAEEAPVGFPAQAIKIIIQPDSASEKDASSDLYREIENHNLNATVRSSPILGIGFGQPFLQPIPLPDISFFEFAPFIPHNSLLWIWTKVGVVGFVAFLYLLALATATGIRAARRIVDPDDVALVAVFGAYIPMTMVVAFVDITFDAQTTVLLGTALALVGSAERLTGLPLPGDPDRADRSDRGADTKEPGVTARVPSAETRT